MQNCKRKSIIGWRELGIGKGKGELEHESERKGMKEVNRPT